MVLQHKKVPGIVALYLLLVCFTALAVHSSAGTSDFSSVFGAVDTHAGCKSPCSPGEVVIDECLDEFGTPGNCDLDFCMHGIRRTAKCAEGDPGAEETACQTDIDTKDWYRQITTRDTTNPCPDAGEKNTSYAKCEFDNGLAPGNYTPCSTAHCTKADGPIESMNEFPGRRICK